MDYQHFGLLATALLVTGLAFVIYRWPQDRHQTFSRHVALRRASMVYYFMLFAVVLPILLAFFIGWFTPHFDLTRWFNIFVILAAILQLACTLVPETGGRRTVWHRALAGASAIFLMPSLALLLWYPTIEPLSKVFTAAALLVMAGCIYLVMKARGNPRNFLVIQCAYFAAFLAPILYITYLQ